MYEDVYIWIKDISYSKIEINIYRKQTYMGATEGVWNYYGTIRSLASVIYKTYNPDCPHTGELMKLTSAELSVNQGRQYLSAS